MKRSVLVICSLCIALTVGLPISRDNEFDELLYRVNELRRPGPYPGKPTHNVINGEASLHRGKRTPVDLERNPLLYDYYAGSLTPIYDSVSSARHEDLSGNDGSFGKRNFDEIDRASFGWKKRYPVVAFVESHDAQKRNFDEIDRYNFGKRNFNEIDRYRYNFGKRNFDEIDRSAFSNTLKRNFDEIDRSNFNGKRTL